MSQTSHHLSWHHANECDAVVFVCLPVSLTGEFECRLNGWVSFVPAVAVFTVRRVAVLHHRQVGRAQDDTGADVDTEAVAFCEG